MAATTKIEWTEATWNPVRGCTKISPGCKNCYAETFAERWRGIEGHPYEQGFDLRLVPEKLTDPLKWKKPRMIFVNSMSDLFHEDVPDEFIDMVFCVMGIAHWHTFQVLTKRADRMAAYLSKRLKIEDWYGHWYSFSDQSPAFQGFPLPNVWMGVSIEDKKHGWPRVYYLRNTPATVRFISGEPLLEDVMPLRLDGIDWVIVGGESGHGARPMHFDWVRSIRDRCVKAGVPFFFKQWGESAPISAGTEVALRACHENRVVPVGTSPRGQAMYRVGKKAAGRLLDGREWNEMPTKRERVPA
jgi:protein gp37